MSNSIRRPESIEMKTVGLKWESSSCRQSRDKESVGTEKKVFFTFFFEPIEIVSIDLDSKAIKLPADLIINNCFTYFLLYLIFLSLIFILAMVATWRHNARDSQ